jgi:membrane fusion protein, multidrug efflux system
MKPRFALSFAVLAASLLAGACSKPPAQNAPVIPVQVASASRISAPLTLDANGVVEPMQTVSVLAQVGGTLDSVLFNEGDEVVAGQVLFKLDPRPFAAALRQSDAALARDQAQAQSLEKDAERYKALVEKDYVTKSQADQAESAAAAMLATVQSDKAGVDNARLNLEYATIRAPITGRTGRLFIRRGNLIRANSDALIVINQLRPILVRFPVVQRDFPSLQRRNALGAVPVRVQSDSAGINETGSLAFLDNAVDSLTASVSAKARFQNQNNVLWPGEAVRVSVQLEVQSNVVAVPTRALVAGQDGNYVFVVGSDKIAKVRPVSVGRAVGTGDMTTIDKGLEAGEQVVVDGQSRLTPNAKVDVKAAPNSSSAAAAAAAQDGSGAMP